MKVSLDDSQTKLLDEFSMVFGLLRAKYEELKQSPYEPRYEKLMRREAEYVKFVLDPSDPSSETMDLAIKLIDVQDSDRVSLQQVSKSIFQGTFRRQLLAKEYVYAIRQMAKWQTLSNDVETLYKRMFEFYSLCPEIRNGFKTVGEREAEVNSHIAHVGELLAQARNFYEKSGNYILGEAALYRSAVKAQVEALDGLLASSSKQLDVFQKLREVGA